jgi:hypothetical protein
MKNVRLYVEMARLRPKWLCIQLAMIEPLTALRQRYFGLGIAPPTALQTTHEGAQFGLLWARARYLRLPPRETFVLP